MSAGSPIALIMLHEKLVPHGGGPARASREEFFAGWKKCYLTVYEFSVLFSHN
jgi:hypothetical protein